MLMQRVGLGGKGSGIERGVQDLVRGGKGGRAMYLELHGQQDAWSPLECILEQSFFWHFPTAGGREGGEAAQFWLRQRFFAEMCSALVELSCTVGVKMVQCKALVETSRIKLSCTGGKMCTRVALDVWSTGEPFVQIWCTAYKCKTGGVEFCVTSSAFCT